MALAYSGIPVFYFFLEELYIYLHKAPHSSWLANKRRGEKKTSRVLETVLLTNAAWNYNNFHTGPIILLTITEVNVDKNSEVFFIYVAKFCLPHFLLCGLLIFLEGWGKSRQYFFHQSFVIFYRIQLQLCQNLLESWFCSVTFQLLLA